LKTKLEPGETVVRTKKRVGYQSHGNYGTLTLTNLRLIWERGPSINLLGQSHFSIPISILRGCRRQAGALVLKLAGAPECWLFFTRGWGVISFHSAEGLDEMWQLITDSMFEGLRHQEPD
jgi:hypothetical protein